MPGGPHGLDRRLAWSTLAVVLAGALALRLWGIRSGLPYVYNVDEAAHFVPKAVAMSSGGLDPHYFVNPPALTYLLHAVFVVVYGGGAGALGEFAHRPDAVFLLARVVVALLGVLAVWLLYLLGARLFEDRRIGLLAAALEAVAFLPVFYGHFALNDAATLVPLTLSLLGSALVSQRGHTRDYALAGIGLGVACATKYTAGIALLPLIAALWIRHRDERAIARAALAGVCALGAFLLANPYALLDFHRFRADLAYQSSLTDEAQGKLGAPRQGGLVYYLWSLTWGLGWVPALAALGGALSIWRVRPRAGWLLVAPILAFAAFMGVQDRYFGRWLLPIFPMLCLLAAFFALSAARAAAARIARRLERPGRQTRARTVSRSMSGRAIHLLVGAFALVGLLAQGAIHSAHTDLVLSRPDTLVSARAWLMAHVQRGARIVLEPIVRNEWLQEGGPGPASAHPARWAKYPELGPLVSADGSPDAAAARARTIEEYELTLTPSLISRYEREGYCWVIAGSTQWGRAFADARRVPWAVAYYRALARGAQLAYRVSPYAPPSRPVSSSSAAPGSGPVAFSFDWSFDYYPLAYERPGPEVAVYRLHGGRCAR